MQLHAIIPRIARPVYTIASHHSVDDAVRLMDTKKTGALVVTEFDKPIGMFAESDVYRLYVKARTAEIGDIQLKNAMARKLIAASPQDDIDALVALMIKSDIKHLPVMEEDSLVGMLRLDDLITYQIENLTAEIRHLKEYIADLHDAVQD